LRKILIFGNSGSGKSTLAKSLCDSDALAHFDLDTIAWLDTNPPERAPLSQSAAQIEEFMRAHDGWVIEGCYADLLEVATTHATEMIFLNLPVEQCVANAKRRPWEPHKYATKEEQDSNIDMLIDWIGSYPTREDACSLNAHLALFESFEGSKTMEVSNWPK